MLSRTRPLASRVLSIGPGKTPSRLVTNQIRLLQTTQASAKDNPTTPQELVSEDEQGLARQPAGVETLPKHPLDYDAIVDYRTS